MNYNDKELLKRFKLEEAQKRFEQLCEYTFITEPVISEDGEDNNEQPQFDNNQNPQQGMQGGNGQPQQDAMPNQGQGGDNNQPQGEMMPGQQDMNTPQMPEQPMNGDMPEDMPPIGDDIDTKEEGDEVIDVDDLTQAQETAEVKIDGVNDKLQNLLNATRKFIQAVDINNKKIDDLRAEFEKRNPSEEERINIRSQASAPYTETPRDYWERKSNDSNYNVIFNNDVDPDKEEEEYVIKRGDISGNDDRSLSKSLDYPSKLTDFLNF